MTVNRALLTTLKNQKGRITPAVPILVLLLQNLAIFHNHYFSGTVFPWDFITNFFPWVTFWVSSIQKGIFPNWVPFQSMGYPIALHLQADLYYPIFWVFVVLKIPYTLHAAVVLQVLHVFAGSVGVFLLLKLLLKDWRYALIGAVIFQFFGGFYGNAEHSDDIRAYALSPWLIYVFTFFNQGENLFSTNLSSLISIPAGVDGIYQRVKILMSSSHIPKRFVFIPLVFFLFATGGYPGNLIAICFVLFFYVIAQLIFIYFAGDQIGSILGAAILLSLLTILGLGMSIIQLGPAWSFRQEFTRFTNYQSVEKMGLWIEHLPGLFLSSKTLPGEVSMNSLFITMPAVVMACFATITSLKRVWPVAVLELIGLLMIPGPQSFFWKTATMIIPPLQYSRFPTSDYRVFIVLPIVILALFGLDDLIHKRHSIGSLFARLFFLTVIIFSSIYYAYSYAGSGLVSRLGKSDFAYHLVAWSKLSPRFAHALSAVLVLAIILIFLFWMWKFQTRLTIVSMILLMGLIFIDGWRVIDDMDTWRDNSSAKSVYQNVLPLYGNGEFIPQQKYDHLPNTRPARFPVNYPYTWRGYIDGSYMMRDPDSKGCPTISCVHILANPAYTKYMLEAWRPLLLSNEQSAQPTTAVEIPEPQMIGLTSPIASPGNTVVQTSYGVNNIDYKVNLASPVLMVENETYFPGWQGDIISGNATSKIQAVDVNGAFRGWWLPAGSYEMHARFDFPGILLFRIIGCCSLLFWILSLIFIYLDPLSHLSTRLFTTPELEG